MEVSILFSALNQSTTPRINGRVVQVAADAATDSRQNANYFKLIVEVTPDGMQKFAASGSESRHAGGRFHQNRGNAHS